MSKYIKYIMIIAMGLALTNCANKTYSIKKEKSNQVMKVPAWYMHDYSERKECDTPRFGKEKGKVCIFGVGTSVSPDLELAIEKANLIAKSEIADKVKGEMNKKAKIFTTELGKSQTKTVVSDVETTLINIISKTPVAGYELFNQEVTLTKNGYYRAWVGLRLPMGKYNKLYNFTIEEVLTAYNVKEMANNAYKDVEEKVVNE